MNLWPSKSTYDNKLKISKSTYLITNLKSIEFKSTPSCDDAQLQMIAHIQ